MQVLKLIKERGFSQTQVAEQMGITRGSLSYCLNHGTPTVPQLRKIAKVIGVRITDFFADEVEEFNLNLNDNLNPNAHPDLNREKPEFVGETVVNGKKYGLVELP